MFSPKKQKGKAMTEKSWPAKEGDSDVYPPSVIAREGCSPWFIGKPRKRANHCPGSEFNLLKQPLKMNIHTNDTSCEEIVIDDNDMDPEVEEIKGNAATSTTKENLIDVPGTSSERSFFGQTKNMSKPINKCNGTSFDFSADVKVNRIKNKLSELIDPEGEQRQNFNFNSKLNNIANRNLETAIQGRRKKGKITNRQMASVDDFKMATGGGIVKEVKEVFPARNMSEELQISSSDNEPSQTTQAKRFLGANKLPSYSAPTPNMVKRAMEMDTSGGGKDEKVGLHCEPTLKHFDENIIALIESEIMSVSTTIGWADVAGLEGAKQSLREIVVWPFQRPDLFKGLRAPPKGVLLFGPPGTGKTMIGRCVASQCNATFFNISASSLTSKWVGEGEKLVRALFSVARLKLPSIIFIDEIDSILSARSESEHESSRRIKTEFLVQLDGVATARDERLLVLAATNRPQELDEAARRRFAKRLYVALPEEPARLTIVRNLLEGNQHDLDESDFVEIARITNGYSGADMHQLCTEAAMGPVRDVDNAILEIDMDDLRPISFQDFSQASRTVRPTVVQDDLVAYEKWDKQFGCKPN